MNKKNLSFVNQILKGYSYEFDLKERSVLSKDDQSFIRLDLDLKSFCNTYCKRFLLVEEGKLLFKFLQSSKEISIDENNIVNEEGKNFEIKTSNKRTISKENFSFDKEIKGSSINLVYNGKVVKSGFLINDLLDIFKDRRNETDNHFVFIELTEDSLLVFDDKTDLPMEKNFLICINKFHRLKTLKKDTKEFISFKTGNNLFAINYGNSEYRLSYTFKVA